MAYLTADQHFSHANIIKHCNRPFKSIEDMDATIIRNHNDTVKPNDTVYHLGDFVTIWRDSFKLEESLPKVKRILDQLNGHHHLILGNHDNLGIDAYREAGFLSVNTYLKLKEFILVHDIRFAYTKHVGINVILMKKTILIGHTHNHMLKTFNQTNIIINVGVDVWGFKPVSINEINELIKGKNNDNPKN